MKQILILISLAGLNWNLFGQSGTLVSRDSIDVTQTELWNLISDGKEVEPEYSYFNELNYSRIIYESDSRNIDGFIIEPKAEGKYPVVIFNRGGNRNFNELTLQMLFFSTSLLAIEGYIIIASNYREDDEFGGEDVNDVLSLFNVVGQVAKADTSRIGMFGWSRGGMMTYLTLKKSNRIKTAVIGNGSTDLIQAIKARPELERDVLSDCIPGYWLNKEAALKKRSAIYWADSLDKNSSVLILCGSQDAQVDHQESVRMAEKLNSIGYDHALKIYDTNHAFRGKRNELNNELIAWFNSHLKQNARTVRKKIAITIDDVPQTRMGFSGSSHHELLANLDELNIPIAIFVNEGLIYKTDSVQRNIQLLEEWVKKKYVTLGNHTYSHSRYSDVGYDSFKMDVEKGQGVLHELAEKNEKPVHHFRFPYNDLGVDSLQHVRMDSLLQSMGYVTSPFTVESSDWMFNALYTYYLSIADLEKARLIGELYVSKTLDYIHFFDSLSNELYGRSIDQIYLCHDNALNAQYLKTIIESLQLEEYEMVGIDEAMRDPVFAQKSGYYKKWGISWLYRWMPDASIRKQWMQKEPDIGEVEEMYTQLMKKE